jgi:hypothetical protein
MLIYDIPAQKGFCSGSNLDGGQVFTWDDSELLVGVPESGEEYKSLLYFNLEDLKAKHSSLLLLEAHLLLNLCLNKISTNTSSYVIKTLLNPWESGISPADIISAEHESILFIIPFHWKESISIDITGIVKNWWKNSQYNHGLVIEGSTDGYNLLGFSNISCQQKENSPQLLLSLGNI